MSSLTGLPEAAFRRQALVTGAWKEGIDWRMVGNTLEVHADAFERWSEEKRPAPPSAPEPARKRRAPDAGHTNLYRHFDQHGRLLYVGISLRVMYRLQQHLGASSWAGQIARVEIASYPSRDIALAAEKRAIENERPLHNIVHASRP